jgi:hypothetical protein
VSSSSVVFADPSLARDNNATDIESSNPNRRKERICSIPRILLDCDCLQEFLPHLFDTKNITHFFPKIFLFFVPFGFFIYSKILSSTVEEKKKVRIERLRESKIGMMEGETTTARYFRIGCYVLLTASIVLFSLGIIGIGWLCVASTQDNKPELLTFCSPDVRTNFFVVLLGSSIYTICFCVISRCGKYKRD